MNDRNAAILWAQSVINNPEKYYILDTETTGSENPEIIELGVIDLAGNEIINQRFKPYSKISTGATQIHGLTAKTLATAPPFDSVLDCLEEEIFKRQLLIYNFYYDQTAIYQTYELSSIPISSFDGVCVMQWYSQFCGEWNNYRGDYKWQKLPGGDHSAIGDCRATLEVIKGMAASPLGLDLQPLTSQIV